MRLIKTFILRLNTNLEQPGVICGGLEALPGRKTYSFRNNLELLNLLQCLVNENAKDTPSNESGDEKEPSLTNPNQPIE
jgi:hypothetical protein